jgi:hypothetical protein
MPLLSFYCVTLSKNILSAMKGSKSSVELLAIRASFA